MADEQWTGISFGNVSKGPSLAVSVWESNPWKDLWLEWFSEDGNPIVTDDYGRDYCYFCVRHNPVENGHDENCVYLRAKQLIESETAVITTTKLSTVGAE